MAEVASKKKLAERIEVIANICVIAAALAFISSLSWFFLRYYSSSRIPPSSVQSGAKINLANVDWSATPQTLLLVLSTECKYCTANMPLYRRLVSRAAVTHNTRLIALFPQPPNKSKEYLDKHELKIGSVQQVAMASLGVKGTPILIFVDANGIVIRSWDGMVPPEAESEIVASMK